MAKYREEYKIVDPNTGEEVGPPQIFEGETKEEVKEKIKAAHIHSAAAFYRTKRAVKLGTLMEPDPDQPIQTFEERPLSADERVALANQLKDPAQLDAGMTRLLEAKFGAPVEVIRQKLRETELSQRIEFTREQIAAFKEEHPEYVESATNRDTLIKYLNKNGWSITKKNLEIAFADLVEDGLIVTRAVKQEPEVEPATVATVSETQLAPAVEPGITEPPTTEPPISGEPTVVRPKVSSSGIGRNASSVGTTGGTFQPKEITFKEVDALSSEEYAKRLTNDPEFARQVEELYAGRKK